jgi:hypothetical protein
LLKRQRCRDQQALVIVDKLVKSPKFRHACEGRHPELFENTGFPPSQGFFWVK